MEIVTFFTLRKNAPLWWYHKSCDLRASAATLCFSSNNELFDRISEECNLGEDRSSNKWQVYLMLCGLSLELIYKAILVAKNQQVPKKHTLKDLADSAGIKTNQEKKDLLSILTEAIIWDGKYPVPTDNQKEMFSKLSELENRILTDYVDWKGFKIHRPNNKLGWESFNLLWKEANEVFWVNHSA